MNIIVCIKQVPDPNLIKPDSANATIIREDVPGIINPVDKNAVETALQMRGRTGGIVTVVTMGSLAAREALQEALAMGADRAILASDRAFESADSLATSYTLAGVIVKLAPFDLLICGYMSLDGGTTQVGPQLARMLHIPHFTSVQKITAGEDRKIQVEILLEDGVMSAEATLPVLVSVIRSINTPRSIRPSQIKKAKVKELLVLNLTDLGLPAERVGFAGSGLYLSGKLPPPACKAAEMINGEPEDIVRQLYERIVKLGFDGYGASSC